MRRSRPLLLSLTLGLGLSALGIVSAQAATLAQPAIERTQAEGDALRILVFSKTAGFRHPSIANGLSMLQALAADNGYVIEASEDAAQFTASNLARFRAIVWLSTTGDVLNAAQQSAFESWLSAGGGSVGIHAAADCEYDWPFYGAQVLGNGAWFQSHPAIQSAEVIRERGFDDSTAHLPARFSITEEWYNFRANPRPTGLILLRLDEASYAPGSGAMGADHPISWKRFVGSGRSWYTGLGHRAETYGDARFRDHVLGGLRWALGAEQRYQDSFER
jgi:cytochrome c